MKIVELKREKPQEDEPQDLTIILDDKSSYDINNYGDDDDPEWAMYHEFAKPDNLKEVRDSAKRTIKFVDVAELIQKEVGLLVFESEDTDEGVGMSVCFSNDQIKQLMDKYCK